MTNAALRETPCTTTANTKIGAIPLPAMVTAGYPMRFGAGVVTTSGRRGVVFPIATKLGIDPIHFGITMTVNTEIGRCHPPVGLTLYVASGTTMRITEPTVAVWPSLLTMLVFLVLIA